MKKYLGIVVLSALVAGSAFAYRTAEDRGVGGGQGSAALVQVAQLEQRLHDQHVEHEALIKLLRQLAEINRGQPEQARPHVLTGRETPPPAEPSVAPPPSDAAPWWQAYRPNMIYLAGEVRYVVINGQMYRLNEAVDDGVVVEAIEDGEVVLRRGRERHRYSLK